MSYHGKPDAYGNYSGQTVEDAFNEVGRRIRAIEGKLGDDPDMIMKLMKMQERLIVQLTEENARLKKELDDGR